MDKLLEIIEKDQKKKREELRYEGRFYYNYRPEIHKVEEFYSNDEILTTKKKNELYINYFKMLVTQKIDYLLSNKPTYDETIDTDNNILTWGLLSKLLLNSSLDRQSWVNLYIKNNKLQYIVVPDNEIIPKYTNDGKELESLIRYYIMNENLYVELWSKSGVKYITYNKDKIQIDEKTINHYTEENKYGEEVADVNSVNYDFIPWVKLVNNKDGGGDIDDILNLIYNYNQVTTGFIENIEKFQEAVAVLKGYTGNPDELEKVMKEMIKIKAVSVGDDGEFGYAKVEIPYEARELILKILREVIFLVGRGVDPSKLAEGSNITNVVLKSRYIQLKFKGGDTIQRLIEFYNEFIDKINKMTNSNYKTDIEFNLSMLINESEIIDNCLKSMGLVSDETLREIHPYVKDAKEEKKRIEEQRKNEVKNNTF